MTYWWLVENFTKDGESTGLYMLCQVNMTVTADVNAARKFRLQRTAEFRAADMREAKRGDWRAVEHGFDDSQTPALAGAGGGCAMSREAFGDPPESQESPQVCPVCGGEWHAEDCEFGQEVSRRLKAERDAHRMQFALHRLWPALERAMAGLVFTADRAGEVQTDMNTLREYSNTPHCPKDDGPCIRGCKPWECRDGWPDEPPLKPDIAALKKRLAEDPGFAAQVTGDRPPTPVGWSDTDWLKHLEEIRQDQETYHRGPLPETGWD